MPSVIYGNQLQPSYVVPSGGSIYATGGSVASGYGGSLQSRLNQAFGGNPGVGSMQPGRVVSMTSNMGGGTTRNSINLQDIIKQMQASQQSANAANLERYTQMMDYMGGLQGQLFGGGGLFAQANNLLSGTGQTARERVDQDRIRSTAQADQGLISRGLGNTTVRAAARRGIGEDAERSMRAIDEQVSNQRAGLLTNQAGAQMQFGGLMTDAMLSRQDDSGLGMYLQLLQQLAAHGG